jgi:O-acetylhomoserine (thiol)-lyase
MANRDPNPVNPTWRPDTVLVHGQGEVHPYGATLPPVVVSTAFEHGSAEQMEEVFAHERVGHAYSRLSNPTVTSLEDRITAISGTREMPARGTVAVASGMSAVALALLGILKTGDHVVASKHLFGGTHTLLETTLCRLGVATTRVDARHDDEIEAAIQP